MLLLFGDERVQALRRDIEIIESQLGRAPRGAVDVVVRCERDLPQVIRTTTMSADASPFPTLLWLTCPVRVRQVGRLEGDGLVGEIQSRVDADTELAAELAAAAREYVRARDAANGAPTPGDASGIGDANGAEIPGGTTGIGGAADPLAVKCLHAHYAHYLAMGRNPVGRIVAGMLSPIDTEREARCANCGV